MACRRHKELGHQQSRYWPISPGILTHWGRVTHICVSKLTTIGSDNGLSPGRRQAIIWTNDGILIIQILGTNFSEILNKIHSFSLQKTHLKMSSAKWRLSRLGLNELIVSAPEGSTRVRHKIYVFISSGDIRPVHCGYGLHGLLYGSSGPTSGPVHIWCCRGSAAGTYCPGDSVPLCQRRCKYTQGWFLACAQPMRDVVTK